MFILRCSFWLLIGFLVIKPFAFEPEQASKALANAAVNGATDFVVQNAGHLNCTDIGCSSMKNIVVASALASKPLNNPTLSDGMASFPVPPPRPDWAG
ncbi:hypothetical protein [Maritalea myrionectae]|uniref:Uncharacterized protein n=1 Tax=Maritalea myrionectae TaxID=454601 RepID=A0A2R4MGI4_9HYPH|nr:hypothetical protein [Maritalea myrionectae]AVX05157.1 hypothetical protein MXMO3_02645 [Maritalea myrionectae]